jgi:hypothetical protein
MTNSGNTNIPAGASPARRRTTNVKTTAADSTANNTNSPQTKKDEKPTKWVQIRLIPIWLRILIVLVLVFVAAIAGLTVGYSILGDGNSSDVLEWSTWQHLLDIVNGKQ